MSYDDPYGEMNDPRAVPPRGDSRRPQGGGQPARRGKPDLGSYVEVKDRLRAFYARYPEGRIYWRSCRCSVVQEVVVEEVTKTRDGKATTTLVPYGVGYIAVKAYAYGTPDDPLPATGMSGMWLPGSTNYTKGSELENAETSARGRALAELDILNDHGIASRDEVGKNRADDEVEAEIAAAEAFAAAQTAGTPAAVASVAPPVASPATEDPGAVSVAPEPTGGQEKATTSPAPEEAGVTMTKFVQEIAKIGAKPWDIDQFRRTLLPEVAKTKDLSDAQRGLLLDALLENARLAKQDAADKA